VLQKYIQQAFGNKFQVFAAFDKQSIGGGKKWFSHITESLKRSKVVLVLVSHTSRRRPWLTFEAGFGDGCGAGVIPISIRNFSLGKLDYPLAGYQGRSIDDLPNILADINKELRLPFAKQDLEPYLSELTEADAQMTYKSLETRPFISASDYTLQFEVKNPGNADIELLMFEVLVPTQWLNEYWAKEPERVFHKFMHSERKWVDGHDYVWFACTSQRGSFGTIAPSLRPIITPAMGVTAVSGMRISLDRKLPLDFNSDCPVIHQFHAVDYPTDQERRMWKELWNDAR
jgi:hypothetical protein